MGDPKKLKKGYSVPRKRWEKERIEDENKIIEAYGLKNKRELYRMENLIRAKRTTGRKLLALDLETRIKREKELLDSMKKIGVLRGNPTLEDILSLKTNDLLERRLQTIVWRKGLAGTTKQARQFITHGHIAINGKKVDLPGYIVGLDEEDNITYHGKEMIVEGKKTKRIGAKKEDAKKELREDFEEAKGDEEESSDADEESEETNEDVDSKEKKETVKSDSKIKAVDVKEKKVGEE